MSTPTDPAIAPPADDSCQGSFAAIALASAQAMDAALAIFLDSDDAAGPHKARVALRRLTTALDAFHPILRRKGSARLRAQAKRIFRLLGRVRDSDVHLDQAGDKAGVRARLARNRQLRDEVRARLRKDRAVAFPNELRRAVQPGGDLYRRSPSAQMRRAAPVLHLAAHLLDSAWDRCLSHGPSVRTISEPARHDLRKDLKTLRYLAEFFSDHLPALQDGRFRADFRTMQDALGMLNDHAVALQIDGRKGEGPLPSRIAAALDQAEKVWSRLSATVPPWRAAEPQPLA
jgi:CHAD domain-containing protein